MQLAPLDQLVLYVLWGYVAAYFETSEAYLAVWALLARNNHTDQHMAYFGCLLEEKVATLFQSNVLDHKDSCP